MTCLLCTAWMVIHHHHLICKHEANYPISPLPLIWVRKWKWTVNHFNPSNRVNWVSRSLRVLWATRSLRESFMQKVFQQQWNCWTPAMWLWISDNITGSHFWTKFWRASTTLTCPSESISMFHHRNRTSWEVIDGHRAAMITPLKPNLTLTVNNIFLIFLSWISKLIHLFIFILSWISISPRLWVL